MCNDGSYCCNNDGLCCSKSAGKFLDATGNIIPNPSQSKSATISPTISPTTGAPAVAATTVHTTPAAESSKGLSAASKGAIGGLVGAVVLIAAAAGFFVWRNSRQVRHFKENTVAMQANQATQPYDTPQYHQRMGMGFGPAELHEADAATTPERRELPSWPTPQHR